MKKKSTPLFIALLLAAFLLANNAMAGNFTTAIDDSLKAQMIKDWGRAKRSTKEFLDSMPETGINFRPMPEMRSFAEQMLHLCGATMNMISMATGIQRTIYKEDLEKEDKYKNKTALLKVVMESYEWIISTLKDLDATKLFSPSMANPRFSCYAVLASAYEHQTHHRSQTVVYLRLQGITPPRERLF